MYLKQPLYLYPTAPTATYVTNETKLLQVRRPTFFSISDD